jgi:segregation and condensation protein B
MADLKLRIEALLYLKAKPMTIEAIASALSCERAKAEQGLIELINDYAHRETALEIVESNLGFALKLRSEFNDLLQKVVPADMSKGTLRTLAAIALKNPITQAELVELRGSCAYQQIQELVAQGFVKKRRQADGRSFWLQVTDKFHQYFEITDLSHLI